MKDSFKQSMDWLHTWSGLVFGWLLFAIFLTGTLTVFDQEITYWMRPELHTLTQASGNIDAAARRLAQLAPQAEKWWIELPSERAPSLEIMWRHNAMLSKRTLDPVTGDVLPARETRGGDFFYRFHYQLLLDRAGIWIVGAAAMAMLVALITGLVIHHRIFKDFFTFRPRSSSHRAWLDAHNVTSVVVLPFHLMITFTGLVIFWTIYMPAGLQVFYGGSREAFWADAESYIERQPAKQPAPLISLADLEQRARPYWKGGQTRRIVVLNPGDRNATVEIARRSDDRLVLDSDRVTFDGVTGELLSVWSPQKPAFLTQSVLAGLHFVQFGDATVRWLYFVMGLAASAMIATGLVLWTLKRREQHGEDALAARGYRLVEGLNVTVVAGLFVAIAVFFWVNRLLPASIADRALWELRCFFLAWVFCLAHSLLRRSATTLWKEQLSTAALMLCLLPAVNALTTDSHLLVALTHGEWTLAGFDLTALATGVLLGVTGWRLDSRVTEKGPSRSTLDMPSEGLEEGV